MQKFNELNTMSMSQYISKNILDNFDDLDVAVFCIIAAISILMHGSC